ncbi:unnamed protein product [Rhizophagus irregularis]|nr:unnamed protein product [Rhizophagus irregularis]
MANEWINWIEEAIVKEHLKYYEYNQFNDIQQIGSGGFGKVYRAKWKNFEHLALKSFINPESNTVKEIVREIKLQRDADYSNNIIRFHGISKFKSENRMNYMLVIEYADGGTLRNYLKKSFTDLTWNNKYNLAYQLACGVSCLHNEGIVHNDLHSCNVLVHQNTIKLADFGLSKRIGTSSHFQSKLFGVIPYVDPKSFIRGRRNNNNQSTQMYSLNEKSDIYSIGVLLWEISSGQRPFYVEDEEYDIGLALEISQGFRETPVTGTPEDYVNLYTKCWDGEPDNRPTIYQVVDWLKTNVPDNFESQTNENTNERIDWIEKAIEEEYLQYYDYKQFSDIRQVGTGGFGTVFRANLKNSEQQFALKSFKLNNTSKEEIINELKILLKVDFHNNIIRFFGITKSESGHSLENHNNKNYMLVMEYADGAYQLARGVSCLHSKGIVHCDLHSGNVLVHQKGIKLADFGLSKKIGTLSNLQSEIFGIAPYIDPKIFIRRRNNNNQQTQMYSLNEKSDVYSVGVLLWEISNGQPPFYVEGEQYDIGLIREISQGLRETVVPGTPENYENIYTKCWDGEPENRPTINQVVDWLKAIITKTNEGLQSSNKQDDVTAPQSTNNESELHISTYKILSERI